MPEKLHKTTDQDRAALIWLLTEIKPKLEQIEAGSMLFQFPESDEVLRVGRAYDEDRETCHSSRKLKRVEMALEFRVARFLRGSRNG